MSLEASQLCRLCNEQQLKILIEFGAHPIAHRFLSASDQEEYTHPVTLALCENCGHVQLIDPIPGELLYTNYNVLSSWKPQPHVPRLADLIEQYQGTDRNVRVLEVGANDGIFLHEMRARGYEQILGVEPAEDARTVAQEHGFEVLDRYFTPAVAQEIVDKYGQCDIFISRQVLEHISDLNEFGEAMQMVMKPGAIVALEVPNFAHNLRGFDYTIWEEHINYFTIETFSAFMAKFGMSVLHHEEILFSGEILTVIGRYEGNTSFNTFDEATLKAHLQSVHGYAKKWQPFRSAFTTFLENFQEQTGKRVVIYGAGCRSCSLVNFAELTPHIAYFVDDQPEKQNHYMPGSRLPVYGSDKLNPDEIGLCLLAVNTENEEKVMSKHADFIAKGGQFASILPPSNRLLQVWDEFIDSDGK